MIEQAIAAFVQEARDILGDLEGQLLQLENDPSPAQVDAIFRGLHTIKGSGSMFGYTALARFTHHFENAYEKVRSGSLPIDSKLIDLSLQAADQMSGFLELGGDGPEAEALLTSPAVTGLIDKLADLCGPTASAGGIAAGGEGALDDSASSAEEGRAPKRYMISFRPEPGALRNGMRPDLLFRELEELGSCTLQIEAEDLPPLIEMDPSTAYLLWQVTLDTEAGRAAIDDVFLFAEDAQVTITEGSAQDTAQAPAAVEPQTSKPDTAAAAPTKDPTKAVKWREHVRVAPERLDDMMDSIGELVIAQARLDAVSETLADSTLAGVVEEVGRLVLGLRDVTLSIRMMPIEAVFGKFRRVVRDLSGALGKDVELVTLGGETEVDKTVIDKIGDPLVHMIRNSIDHGLETAEDREAASKPPQGTVHLVARQEGGEILISIQDDGRGLDSEAIRQRAVERGLIDATAELTERELNMLIFEPGFSTAKTVSDVSGRGVGMDAVKTAIEALSGSIDIMSLPGQGTCITLRLPVTLAIIDGLRVRLGESVYVIPLSSVEECVEMNAAEATRSSGRSVLQIREHLVPFLTLDSLFGLPGSTEARRRVVVVRVDGQRIGLVVDDILGQGQTVIKSLSPYHRDISGLGGATILGDGRVALIIDVATLVRWAEVSHGPQIREVA